LNAIISDVNVCSPFSFHLKAQNTTVVWHLVLQVAWGRGSTSPQPQPSSLLPHPSPSITVGHHTSLWRGGLVVPPPDPNPPPSPALSVILEVWGWEMRTVCVGRGGGGLEVKPRPFQIQKHRGYRYDTCLFDFAPSPIALSFIPGILLQCLVLFSSFSYSAQFHYPPSPMTISFFFVKLFYWLNRVYMYIQQFSEKADTKNQVNFSFLYIIMITIPSTKQNDICIEDSIFTTKSKTTIRTDSWN
jgi:hypothetical protein